MDQSDERLRNQMDAILRVLNLAKCVNGDDVPCQIEEGLFLGSFGAATNKNALKNNNITHILTVAASMPPPHPNDFVYSIVDVRDTADTNIRQYFDECFKFIDDAKENGGNVLVHCFAGRSRSATVVIAYLMKKHGISLLEALQHVKSKRPQIAPNGGFMLQLQDFEKFLLAPQPKYGDAPETAVVVGSQLLTRIERRKVGSGDCSQCSNVQL